MTTEELLKTIRAEIERRKEIHFADYHINKNGNSADYGACNALTQLLAFIDSLPEEKPEVDLEKEIDEFWSHLSEEGTTFDMIEETARHFYELGQASVPMPEEQPSKDLDVTDFSKPLDPDVARAIADNWWNDNEQTSKDLEVAATTFATDTLPLGEGTYVDGGAYRGFKAGSKWQKEQMMEDAVEYKVCNNLANYPIIYYEVSSLGLKYGDKVKIIILKDDENNK